ncbi:hypothetical protein M426DRAFT_15541 [Hypoxylon sp. CI-4A]|nr:hypothetical protein M426DRAFT_15541 [Hypoxylon sp. CI-4A]
MSWTHEGAYWRRPLDCHDKLFQSIAAAGTALGREHWLMVGWLQLGISSTMDSATQGRCLRSAWSALRLRHPDVASTLREDEKRYVPLADTQDLERWTDATFSILLGGSSTPASAVVGSEAVNLVPTLDAVLGMPSAPKDEWAREVEDILAPFLDGSPAIGLPITPALPGDTVRIEIVFSKDVTTVLREACRTRGFRPTAALHASIVLETMRYYNQKEGAAVKARYKS